jgi:hypothetical protein
VGQHTVDNNVILIMRFLICIVILLPAYGFNQNLLVNPGFEEENICSEYKVNCAPEGWINNMPSLVYYFNEPLLAHNGSKFVTLIAGHSQKPYYRTFVRSKLLCGLQKGKIYRLELFVKSIHPILDSMGVYLTPAGKNLHSIIRQMVMKHLLPLEILVREELVALPEYIWRKIFLYWLMIYLLFPLM